MKVPVPVLLAAMALIGCSNSEVSSVTGADTGSPLAAPGMAAATGVGFRTVDRNVVGPWTEACADLFTSAAEWDAAMSDLAAAGGLSVLPGPEAPAVDWKRESVVLVTLGEQGSGASGVEIKAMHRQGNHAVLDVEVTPPGPYAYMTAPYHIIRFDAKGIRSVEVRIR